LIRDFDLTQETAAERVGRGRATVANSLRLLGLDNELQGFIAKSLLSVGHAKVLLGVEGSAERLLLARRSLEATVDQPRVHCLLGSALNRTGERQEASGFFIETEHVRVRSLDRVPRRWWARLTMAAALLFLAAGCTAAAAWRLGVRPPAGWQRTPAWQALHLPALAPP